MCELPGTSMVTVPFKAKPPLGRFATLLAKVWGREYVNEVDYIRVYIRRLRDKLGDDPDDPTYIRTERGLGYRFVAPA